MLMCRLSEAEFNGRYDRFVSLSVMQQASIVFALPLGFRQSSTLPLVSIWFNWGDAHLQRAEAVATGRSPFIKGFL